jgi:signal transduction histidine kinase/CheY-like chemotaxis protein
MLALTIYTSLMMNSISTFLKEDIQARLLVASKLAAVQVTPEELEQLDSPEDVDSPQFQRIRARLVEFAENNDIIFVYYMRKNEDGLYQFIIDNDMTEETVNLASEPIDAEPAPEAAYGGVAATSGLENYSIGYTGLLSAFAPVYDERGDIIAVAGVDISDEHILAVSTQMRNLIILLIFSVVFVVASGLANIYLQVRKERRLKANLEQQKLMSEISQSFISNEPITALIGDALYHTGKFLQVDRCLIAIVDKATGAIHPVYLWSSMEEDGFVSGVADVAADDSGEVFEGMFPSVASDSGTISAVYCNDIDSEDDNRRAVLERAGLKSFIMVPLYIEGALWGILSIESRTALRRWNDNDVQLVGTVSSAIVGAVARDLIEKERAVALERAVLASHAKGDFLSNMSHEMRTPMNAIIGMSTIGLSVTEIERKDHCLKSINDASAHLLGIINDVLDMSKIEADKLELSFISFNFKKMIEKVVNLIAFRLDERQQELLVTVDENIPKNIVTDDQRLTQVIMNLLSNAVKFTPEGGTIRLNSHLLREESGQFTVQIEVSDTGIGISPEQQDKLFTSFEQADSGTARKFGGTGLGLAISKRIVMLMGGDIWIESQLGEGATFLFTIKVRRGRDEEHNYLPADVSWNNVRVLTVDDAEETRDYFGQVAERFGISCDTAASGEEALAKLAQTGNYDVCFVDWRLPGIDGMEVTQRIKTQSDGRAMVVMISSAEWHDIEVEALRAGVDRFVQKPLSLSSIADCLNGLFAASAIRQSEIATEDLNDLSEYRILIAEDVEVNREVVLALLEPTGLMMECSENGLEALERFREEPARYDLIFMDVQMPEMDGYEATRMIRALDIPEAKAIPIVAMTANVFREDVENCLSAGMDDHVGKPLDLSEVISILRKWLPVKER